MRLPAAIALALTVFVPAPAALAQDRPVVSGFNAWGDIHSGWSRLAGKGLDYWYNTNIAMKAEPPPQPCNSALCYVINDQAEKRSGLLLGGEARAAMPIGHYFGAQADGGLDRMDGLWLKTARAHLFMGLAGNGTLGPMVQYAAIDRAHAWRIGVGGQAWLGPVSLYGAAGHQRGHSSRQFAVASGAFFCGEARWYADDNAVLGIGGGAGPSKNFVQANGELQFDGSLKPVSVFVRGAIGETAYRSIVAGVRLHWGNGATLMARHRQDMPIPYAGCGIEQFDHKDIGLYYSNAG